MTLRGLETAGMYYLVVTGLCLFEYHYQVGGRSKTRKLISGFLSLFAYVLGLGYVIGIVPHQYTVLALPVIMSMFSVHLLAGGTDPIRNIGFDLIGLIWICVPMYLCLLLSVINGHYDPTPVYGTMIFVFFSDAGAYFAGKYLGVTKLYPSISPNKTWEGVIGGTITSLMCIYPVTYWSFYTVEDWTLICLISIACGVVGDLIESMFKRDLQIKDTSNMLPGHGGIVDRMDGVLYAVPFVYSYLVITQ